MSFHYRTGRKQPRNVYRHTDGDEYGEYIGVFFEPENAQTACDSMNADHGVTDVTRVRRDITRDALLSAAEWLDRTRPEDPGRALRARAEYNIE